MKGGSLFRCSLNGAAGTIRGKQERTLNPNYSSAGGEAAIRQADRLVDVLYKDADKVLTGMSSSCDGWGCGVGGAVLLHA